MAKKGKTARPAIKHSRTVKDGTHIEERGLRRIELNTEKPPGKKSIFESEHPPDMAHLLYTAAERFFEKANEKTLDQVLYEAAAITGTGTDPLMRDAKAIDNWLADLVHRHGALSPISVAAQFLVESRNIITHLVKNVPGAQLAIGSATADKIAEDVARLFKHIYLFADAWHWWRMELHGDHQRLLDAHSVAASRQKGAASNQKKKSARTNVIAEAVAKWKKANNDTDPDPVRIAGEIFEEVRIHLKPLNVGAVTSEGLLRVVQGLLKGPAPSAGKKPLRG
jgi:hypothetical protein